MCDIKVGEKVTKVWQLDTWQVCAVCDNTGWWNIHSPYIHTVIKGKFQEGANVMLYMIDKCLWKTHICDRQMSAAEQTTWQRWWCLWQTRGGGRVKAGPCCCRNEKDVRISQLTFYNRFEFRTRFTWTPHSNCVSFLPPLFCVLLGLHTCTSTSSLHSLTKSLCNLNQFLTHFTSFWISAIVFGKNVSLGVFWTVSP